VESPWAIRSEKISHHLQPFFDRNEPFVTALL
jgi:hypothetical protein